MSEKVYLVHDLIERLGNLVRADVRAVCHASGVRPVQLEALHYLTQCNRYSDTPQAVAEYLGLTKGTVSQTLKVLEEKGLLKKRSDPGDKRVVHLTPTASGRRLVERVVPSDLLAMGVGRLSKSEQKATGEALRLLLRSVQKANSLRTFAPCHSCRFNQKIDDGYLCELTQESLTADDVVLICREHQYSERAATDIEE
ncbi:MAG: MarR family transcriptional regulator [Gammaproteobacteria bacterium]|nr:MarR family transcriptional regulator [Gammaproteobacteria bacterium]